MRGPAETRVIIDDQNRWPHVLIVSPRKAPRTKGNHSIVWRDLIDALRGVSLLAS